MSTPTNRVVKVFRYDPTVGGTGHYDRFELHIEDPTKTTILDLLIRIQREQDPSVAFRYACRVNMCGSCGMVINGREGLACKVNVSDLPADRDITLRPLNHFPVVKDLVVDMKPFFKKYEESMPFFEPATLESEPAVIRPDSRERRDIGLATECIQCGCCVSSCTMINYHDDYCGPAGLNRAFSLLADSREGLNDERLCAVLQSCYHCRTEFNCTEVCPKDISPTRAIKYIERLALKRITKLYQPSTMRVDAQVPADSVVVPQPVLTTTTTTTTPAARDVCEFPQDPGRRRFLKRVVFGVGAASAVAIGGLLASAAVGPVIEQSPARWIPIAPMRELPSDQVTTVTMRYELMSGFHKSSVIKPVIVCRWANENELVVFNTTCTHLGCTVHWDEKKNIFECACHGGQFDRDGKVIAGPPPRPLDRYRFKVENGYLMVEVV